MINRFHRYLGYLMCLPFLVWVITGTYFFFKPGYSEAYAQLKVKTYPLIENAPLLNNQLTDVEELRWLRSVLGYHLLVKQHNNWQQLEPTTLTPRAMSSEDIELLVNDAIAGNERYGEILQITDNKLITSKGINITLNWQQMSITQRGADTDFINQMYKLHYLQWTGIKALDQVLGVIGLALVLLLAVLGIGLSNRRAKVTLATD
jgi:hypothetical protein